MYVRLFPPQTPAQQPFCTLTTDEKYTSLRLRGAVLQQEQQICVSRVFPPEFSSANAYAEVGALARYLQGEDAVVIVVGQEKSGKHFTFLSVISYVLDQKPGANIQLGRLQEVVVEASKTQRERIAKETRLASYCRIFDEQTTLHVLKAPSYAQEHLMFYSALLAPKIYYSTTPLLSQNVPLEQLFAKGRYLRNVCFLCSFQCYYPSKMAQNNTVCSLPKFLGYLDSLFQKCYQQQADKDSFDIVQSIAQIQRGFKERYEDAVQKAAALQETLDQERRRFASELQDLNGQLTQQLQQNELLCQKAFALEQENAMLRDQVRGVERCYQDVQSQCAAFGSVQSSLRERLKDYRSAKEDLRETELRRAKSLRESEVIAARRPRAAISYKKAEDW